MTYQNFNLLPITKEINIFYLFISLTSNYIPLIYIIDSSQFKDSYPQNNTSINQHSNLSPSNITCKEDFIEINNTCLPRCDRFELTTHSGALLLIYSELIASCLAVLICILIVILSIKNYKTM